MPECANCEELKRQLQVIYQKRNNVEMEVQRLREAIEKAPHGWCSSESTRGGEPCDCWKRDALRSE